MQTASRTFINRANSQHSTGPKTAAGKERSAQNSFKHGLYSDRIIQAHESPEEYARFRAALLEEHQPVNTTETFLVDELAQNGWKIRRLRAMEAKALSLDSTIAPVFGILCRALASAERAFHRALTTLSKLQHERGFVPSKPCEAESQPGIAAQPVSAGFVLQTSPAPLRRHRPASAAAPAPTLDMSCKTSS